MNTKHLLSFLFLFIFFLFLFITNSLSQPQFYNYTSQGTANSFPFNQTAGKMVQWIILPGEYNQPTPATPGNITKFYFYVAPTYPLNATYTGFCIRMGRTSLTNLPAGQFFSGQMDTVFYRASGYTINSPASAWWEFVLDTPFPYYPDSSLVIEIGQCSSTQGTGFSVIQQNTVPQQRLYSVGGCPFVYSGAQTSRTINSGITVVPASTGPDYLHYKFENNPTSTLVFNCAIPGVGINPAPFTVHTLGSGGQFDSCLVGTGGTNSGIATGWQTNLGSGSWTISMWLNDLPVNTSLYYLFGESTGSFRCFLGGAAGAGNITLRGTGITNVDVPGVGPGPTVVHFVYDSAASNIKAYKNGVLAVTISQTPLNLANGTGFKVGAYSTSAGLFGKMDEFRLYHKALTAAEVLSTWNQDIACGVVVGINNNNNNIPANYSLEQNYPNPFNPSTKINFSIPKSGMVDLRVFDILGREVAALINGMTQAGTHSVEFNASELSSGVYLYTLKAGDFKATKKMLLIK